jgi:hypothetical protein
MIRISDTKAKQMVMALLQAGEADPEEIGSCLEVAIRKAVEALIQEEMVEVVPGTEDLEMPKIRRRRPAGLSPLRQLKRAMRTHADDCHSQPTPVTAPDRSSWVTAERMRVIADMLEAGALEHYQLVWAGPKTDAEMPLGSPVVVFMEEMVLTGDEVPEGIPVKTVTDQTPPPEGFN